MAACTWHMEGHIHVYDPLRLDSVLARHSTTVPTHRHLPAINVFLLTRIAVHGSLFDVQVFLP